MLLDYAITPQVFEKSYIKENAEQQFALVALLQDISQRGMITALNNKDWTKEVQSRVSNLSKTPMEKLQTLLKKLKDRQRIVGHPKDENQLASQNEEQWLIIARNLDRHAKFTSIVAREVCEDCVVPSIAYELTSDIDQGTQIIVQNEENMKKELSSLLRYARKVTLIDPYFNVSIPRFKKSFFLIAESLSERRGERLKESRIIINVRHANEQSAKTFQDRTDTAEYDKNWKEMFEIAGNKYGHKCELRVWDDGKKMHDRFLITNQCGVQIGLGLDVDFSSSRESSWNLVRYDQLSKKLESVEENSSPYKLIKRIN